MAQSVLRVDLDETINVVAEAPTSMQVEEAPSPDEFLYGKSLDSAFMRSPDLFGTPSTVFSMSTKIGLWYEDVMSMAHVKCSCQKSSK